MTIATLADYRAANRQWLTYIKTSANNVNQNASAVSQPTYCSMWTATGLPAAGSFAIGNTANGLVPTDATTGAVYLPPFSGDAQLTRARFNTNSSSALPRVILYDRLFHAGTYSFNAAVSLTSQPSYSSRVPGGTDYKGTQIWIEVVTAFTGLPTFVVTYTDDQGNPGHSTPAFSPVVSGSPPTTVSQSYMLPLAAGDHGVQTIESVTCTVATVGTFNVLVVRPLLYLYGTNFYCPSEFDYWLDTIGMSTVFQGSCLSAFVVGGSSIQNDIQIEIAS